MQELVDLYRYNTWANERVFASALGAQADVSAAAAGTHGTILSTLGHMARVEYVYLAMMDQREPEDRETYMAHDLPWYRDNLREVADGFQRLLQTVNAEQLERDMRIPWFDFPVTVRDGLLQVLTHSSQHRSQVLSWLSAQGVETPNLDYVELLDEQQQR